MKRLQLLVTALTLLGATAGTMLMTATAQAATAPAAPAAPAATKVRLGTYDSRSVALVWGRQPGFRAGMRELLEEYKAADAAGDTSRMRRLDQEGLWRQVRLHQRVFSTAGAADLLAPVRDKLPAIAQEAGVVAIVSKWELPYSDPAVELVDVTAKVVALFAPGVMGAKMAEDIMNEPPKPLDEIRLDGKD